MENEYILPFFTFIFIFFSGMLVDKLVKASRPVFKKDTGVFWFYNAILFFCLFVIFSFFYFLISFFVFDSSELVSNNHYAIANGIANIFGLSFSNDFEILFANLLSLFWFVIIIISLSVSSERYEYLKKKGWHRSLVGAISSKVKSRYWITYIFLPPLLLALAIPVLLQTFNTYPYFVYNASMVFFVLIILIASSKPNDDENKTDNITSNPLKNTDQYGASSWSEKLKEEGVDLKYLGIISGVKDPETKRAINKSDFSLRTHNLLKNSAADQLITAIEDLLTPGGGIEQRHKQIRAQDDCGQFESVAIAAEVLFLRYYTMTLWIAPEAQIAKIQEQLNQFFSYDLKTIQTTKRKKDDSRVYVITLKTPYPENESMILLTDPKTLSDSFMETLVGHELILPRIGMVVWWDLHEYTGVLAGNMWAIIHRLHRLIELKGRNDIRLMAFFRQAYNQEANINSFAQELLPFEFLPKSIVNIPVKQYNPVHLYKLDGITSAVIHPPAIESQQHTLLYAIRASILAGWKTCYIAPSICLTHEEIESFLSRQEYIYELAEYRQISEYIPTSSAYSQALILQLDSKNALAIAELVASLGRADDTKINYIGVLTNGNKYIDFILKKYCSDEEQIFASQSLLAPKPSREIITRHMKKALYETSSTLSDIKADFHFEDKYIEQVLGEIKKDEHLRISEVRYLVNGNLKVEPEYRSIAGRTDHSSAPLDTNSSELVKIIAPALAGEQDGLRIEIDSHRVTILAYPGRVFYHKGRRFEISTNALSEWQTWEVSKEVRCVVTDRKIKTLRIRVPSLFDTVRISETIVGDSFSYFQIELNYEESIEGYISKTTEHSVFADDPKVEKFSKDLFSKRFLTKAQCIDIPNANFDAIESIAEALYYALPVHLGVDEDTFEIIAVKDLDIENVGFFTGIVIVELYSTGVGLVEMFDMRLLPKIFKGVKYWLEDCSCADGCQECILGEQMRYPGNKRKISKQEALKVLSTLV